MKSGSTGSDPGGMGSHSGGAGSNPGGMGSHSGGAGRNPGGAGSNPGGAGSNPGGMGTKSGGAGMNPGDMGTNPGGGGDISGDFLANLWKRVGIIRKASKYMSYDFVNQSTEICRKFSRQSWAKALELAQLYGWRPMGTKQPPHLDFYKLNAEWDGRYLTNDGQIVKAEDALFLAIALEKSAEDIPDTSTKIDWNSKFWLEDDLPEWLSPDEREMIEEGLQDGLLDIMGINPLEYFAGDEKRHLEKFIRFCRSGSFEIL